jgi:hypothetical protein
MSKAPLTLDGPPINHRLATRPAFRQTKPDRERITLDKMQSKHDGFALLDRSDVDFDLLTCLVDFGDHMREISFAELCTTV